MKMIITVHTKVRIPEKIIFLDKLSISCISCEAFQSSAMRKYKIITINVIKHTNSSTQDFLLHNLT